jgi:predicted esterase/3',5'-cyclic AMP phosphodiesterase CpdA
VSRRRGLLLFGFVFCLLMVASCSAVLFQGLQGANADLTPADSGVQALGAGPSEDFTVLALPDTQLYSESYPGIFDNQTQWIVNMTDNLNVAFVTHEGDIVNQDVAVQWQNANRSLSKLDGHVPWAVLPGNHDGTSNFNTFFGYGRFADKIWYGGHYSSSNNANSYELFSGGGDDYLIFHFQNNPSDAVLSWANQTIAAFPDRRVIVTTHDYLTITGSRSTVGGNIWSKFVQPHADQVFLVLCGHNHSPTVAEVRRTDTVGGHVVYQLLADFQERANGGNGFLRILRFSPSQDKIYVTTFSPYLNIYESDADSQFTLNYSMTGSLVNGFLVSLQSPDDEKTTVDNMPDFEFTVTHPSQLTFNCSLWLQNASYQAIFATKYNSINGSLTTMTPNLPIPNGNWWWWINCTDGSASSISDKRIITIDVFRGDKPFVASFDGSTRYYWLDLPDNFDATSSTPLVFYLHGYGGSRYSYYQQLPVLRQVFQNHTWIVVSVECREKSGYDDWYIEQTRRDITDVLNLLRNDYAIDSSRIHIMGRSMGGGGALKYAMFNPQIIASIVDIHGISNFTRFYNDDTQNQFRASLIAAYGGTPSQVPQVYASESALGNEIRFKHTPVMIIHGTLDQTVNVAQSRTLNQSLSALGYTAKYIEVSGGDHSPSIVYGREMEIFNWFNDHPMWGNTHLLLNVQPNQEIYARGQPLILSVTVLNQANPALEGILTLTISGSGKYCYLDFQAINVTADSVREYSFEWNMPNVAGTYVLEVNIVPTQLTAFDAAWLKVT